MKPLFQSCRWWRAFSIGAAAVFAIGATKAVELREFTSRSFTEIRDAAAGRPLVVVFWSTACVPCADEMGVLARLHRAYPSVNIQLVAVDPPGLRPKVERFLARHELGAIETWQFGGEAEERLRYSVDRSWRGELPRAYFLGADGGMVFRSGVLDEKAAAEWFAKAAGRSGS